MNRYFLSILFFCIFLPTQAKAVEALKFNTSIKPPFSTVEQTGFFDLLIVQLGKELNMDVTLVRMPPARALFSVNEGISDGELPRIAGLQKKYPNLVQIEEKVIDYNFVAFSRGELPIQSWEDLAGKRVGYLIGWKIFENNIPKTAHITKLQKPDLLFDMLDKGRLDIALYERHAGWNIIRAHGHQSIKEGSTPLAVKPMFLYLHKSHQQRVPGVTKALKDIKKRGTYQKIYTQTLQ